MPERTIVGSNPKTPEDGMEDYDERGDEVCLEVATGVGENNKADFLKIEGIILFWRPQAY
jgi:hypothetical protein